jgi:hypothetical protein
MPIFDKFPYSLRLQGDNDKIIDLCLSLQTKKEVVKKTNICCMQEAEIEIGFPLQILSFTEYNCKEESNTVKGLLLNNNRESDLKRVNSHLVLISCIKSSLIATAPNILTRKCSFTVHRALIKAELLFHDFYA